MKRLLSISMTLVVLVGSTPLLADNDYLYSRLAGTWTEIVPWGEADTYTGVWTDLTEFEIAPPDIRIRREAPIVDTGNTVYRLSYTYGRIIVDDDDANDELAWYDWDFRTQAYPYPSTSTFWGAEDYKGDYTSSLDPGYRRYYAYKLHDPKMYELYDGLLDEIRIDFGFDGGGGGGMRFELSHDQIIIQ